MLSGLSVLTSIRIEARRSALVLIAAVCLGCGAENQVDIEEVFAARREVTVRAELAPGSPTVAKLALGDRVHVQSRRRALLRVKTGAGVEGWARESEFVTEALRAKTAALEEHGSSYPSQGVMHAFDTLNVHLEPERDSPTIFQLAPDEAVDLLRRYRNTTGSRTETWALLRSPAGPVGWALASRLYAGIPVEVAQFAEGKRIIAYFDLGEETDPKLDEPKTTWLWAQKARGTGESDFDRFRVFRWSAPRAAYQTIGLGRGIEGYLPIETFPEVESERGKGPGFALKIKRDGGYFKRTYVLLGARIHRVSEERTAPPERLPRLNVDPPMTPEQAPPIVDRVVTWLRAAF